MKSTFAASFLSSCFRPIPRFPPTGWALATAMLLIVLPGAAFALNPRISKLHPPGSQSDDIDDFGTAVAVSDKWVVVGDPGRDSDTGAVHVYHAATGRLLRTLLADDRDADHRFGASVALCGDRVVVGAPGDEGDRGAAYVFDLRNGRQLTKLAPASIDADDAFGTSVAMTQTYLLVGAPGENVTPAVEGAAYLFDNDFTQVRRYRPTDATGLDRFGESVEICGEIVLVGAPDNSEAASGAGAVYVYPTFSGSDIKKLLPPGGGASADSRFGCSLATDGKYALIGASESDRFVANAGAAFLFDLAAGSILREFDPGDMVGAEDYGLDVALSGDFALVGRSRDPELHGGGGSGCLFSVASGEFIQKILPPDGSNFQLFAHGVALSGNLMVLGATGDDDVKDNAGAAYFYRQLAGPAPLTTMAKAGDFAPGIPGADFRAFSSMGINGSGEVAILSSLAGPNSGGNRDRGLWTDAWSPGTLEVGAKSRQLLESVSPAFMTGWDDVAVQSIDLLAFQNNDEHLAHVRLRGPGINRGNRDLIMNRGVPLVQTGDVVGPLTQPLQRFFEASHSAGANQYATVVVQAKRGGNIDASNDTGILRFASNGNFVQSYTEGFFAQGQLFGRCAASSDDFMTWGGYYFGNGPRPVQGAMTRSISGSPPDNFIHGEMEINGLAGVFPRGILGETELDGDSYARATLRGDGINRSNNEGVYLNRVDAMIFRKGESPGVPNSAQVIARIVQFWPIADVDFGKGVALVKLRGPGVNGRNDCALVRVLGLGFYEVLLREGDPVCDWDCPNLGTIQRVDVDPASGNYVVVASMTGSPRRNQGLFTGHANAVDSEFRKATLRMRKGIAYQARGGDTTTLRSIVLAPFPTRSGVGGTGKTQVVNSNGEVVVCLQFDNRAKEIMVGTP